MNVKEESEKAGLKLNIQTTKIWHPFQICKDLRQNGVSAANMLYTRANLHNRLHVQKLPTQPPRPSWQSLRHTSLATDAHLASYCGIHHNIPFPFTNINPFRVA